MVYQTPSGEGSRHFFNKVQLFIDAHRDAVGQEIESKHVSYTTKQPNRSEFPIMLSRLLWQCTFALPKETLMFKHAARNFALALTLTALVTPTIQAQTTITPSSAVTGGDPEPTSPDVVQMILVVLHLG